MDQLPTPCYLVDEGALRRNLEILKGVADRTGCKILLAQKAFSMYSLYPLIGEYLAGTASSGLFEARLGHEEMGGETHVFSAAYRDDEFDDIADLCDHIVFNSLSQFKHFQNRARGKSLGIRVNPQCSTQEGHEIYDPCAPGSRLGATRETLPDLPPAGLSGLHFHTLCEQGAEPLQTTLAAVEEQFGPWLARLSWINLGGGHHITKPGYNLPLLEECICRLRDKYRLAVYLEPGEAVALDAGYLWTTVLDTVQNRDTAIAILDTSAACHMPDVLEMPYRPPLFDSGEAGEKAFTYRLAGPTCLSGDVIGDYSFDRPLASGDRLRFGDMAIYTMVKNNTFNGMPLPAIALQGTDGDCRVIRRFQYEDFKTRLS